MSTHETSLDPNVPAVEGDSPKGGVGVLGISALGHGVRGESTSSRGVVGQSDSFHGVYGHSRSNVGVAGESQTSDGVWGVTHDAGRSGVYGLNQAGGRGVAGFSNTFQGVYGHSDSNAGVVGESGSFDGIWGVAYVNHKSGVYGQNHSGGTGVTGSSDTFRGVYGHSGSNAGVVGESDSFDGVWGVANVKERAGIVGKNNKGGLAGYFDGDVVITRELNLSNADFAEDFDMAGHELVEPGTVLVLGDAGGLQASRSAYDKRVAGVVSGAGGYKPGIVLDKTASTANRQPVALVGKVCCKADAAFGAIAIGDLLTTSPTPGHAMRADDPTQAFGAVIGKALGSLTEGRGLVPILIALQ